MISEQQKIDKKIIDLEGQFRNLIADELVENPDEVFAMEKQMYHYACYLISKSIVEGKIKGVCKK